MKILKNYLSKHKKTDIIFDFDATLFELILPWDVHNTFQFGERELRALDNALLDEYIRQGDVEMWARLQNEYVKKYGEKAKKIFDVNNHQFEYGLLRGVKRNDELLDFVRNTDEFTFYIWSSNTRPVIEKVLREHDLFDRFRTLVTRHEVNYLKPHPEGFRFIHDKKTDLDDFLFVGDSSSDEGAAKAIGVDFFKVAF